MQLIGRSKMWNYVSHSHHSKLKRVWLSMQPVPQQHSLPPSCALQSVGSSRLDRTIKPGVGKICKLICSCPKCTRNNMVTGQWLSRVCQTLATRSATHAIWRPLQCAVVLCLKVCIQNIACSGGTNVVGARRNCHCAARHAHQRATFCPL